MQYTDEQVHAAQQSNQAAFDHIVNHLRYGNGRAMDPKTGVCVYRSEGRVCAVGSIITDADIENIVDFKNTWIVSELMSASTVKGPNPLSGLDRSMLLDLQMTHDGTLYWASDGEHSNMNNCGEVRIMGMADKHGVVYTPPKDCTP